MAPKSRSSPLRWPTFVEVRFSLVWLLYVLVGGLFPTWGSILLLLLFGQAFAVSDLAAGGEFALYAASLIPATLFVMQDDRAAFPCRRILTCLCCVLLLLATLIFAASFISTHKLAIVKVNSDLVVLASAVVYGLSVVIGLAVTLLDVIQSGALVGLYKPRSVARKQLDALRGKLQRERRESDAEG